MVAFVGRMWRFQLISTIKVERPPGGRPLGADTGKDALSTAKFDRPGPATVRWPICASSTNSKRGSCTAYRGCRLPAPYAFAGAFVTRHSSHSGRPACRGPAAGHSATARCPSPDHLGALLLSVFGVGRSLHIPPPGQRSDGAGRRGPRLRAAESGARCPILGVV